MTGQPDLILVHTLVAVLGVCVGATYGLAAFARRRWPLYAMGFVATVLLVVVAFLVGSAAPFLSPLFLLAVVATDVAISATMQRDHPLFADEPFWRRALLLLAHPRYLPRHAPAHRH